VKQCFSLTPKQPQPAYKPQKQPAEQGDLDQTFSIFDQVEDILDKNNFK
jgi:hypothetical protein